MGWGVGWYRRTRAEGGVKDGRKLWDGEGGWQDVEDDEGRWKDAQTE
jgi:hypothetical protein